MFLSLFYNLKCYQARHLRVKDLAPLRSITLENTVREKCINLLSLYMLQTSYHFYLIILQDLELSLLPNVLA